MRLIIKDLYKSKDQLGSAVGGKYLKRVITGKDKDGSPQYRYIRTQEELEAYNKKNKGKKKDKGEELKEKTDKEHKEHVSLLTAKQKDKKGEPEKKEKPVKKGLYINVS